MKLELVWVVCLLLTGYAGSTAYGFTDLSDSSEPWKQKQYGVSDEVPYPFEPLVVLKAQTQTDVKCWGRTYMLNAPFPVQIESQSKTLLSGPMRLIVKQGGTITKLEDQILDIGAIGADRVEFDCEMKCGPLRISVPGAIEYDGLIDIDLTISADGPTEIEQLSVQIPIAADVAKFYHFSTQWGKYGYGRIDELPAEGLELDWQAFWWIGDDYRGLSFVTETWGGWTGPREEAFSLRRTDEGVVLSANIINEPRRIEGERKYRIGIQATPGKPLPDTWHGRHVGGAGNEPTPASAEKLIGERGVNIALLWNDSAKFFSYPEPKDPEAFKQAVKTYHDAGLRCVYVLNPES